MITDVQKRVVVAELPEDNRLFRWVHIRKTGKELLITVMHGWPPFRGSPSLRGSTLPEDAAGDSRAAVYAAAR